MRRHGAWVVAASSCVSLESNIDLPGVVHDVSRAETCCFHGSIVVFVRNIHREIVI